MVRARWSLWVLAAVVLATVLVLPDSADASSVGLASVHLSATAAGVTRVHYVVDFRTSSAGALPHSTSTITVAAPAGTVFPSGRARYTVRDLNTGVAVRLDSGGSVTRSAGNATVTLTSPLDIAARDAVEIAIGGITNGPAGAQHLMISTSADTTAAGAAYTLVTPVSVASPTLQLSTRAGGVSLARYVVQFATSKSGGLAADGDLNAAARITLSAPAGTVFPSDALDYFLTNLNQNRRQRLDCCGGSVTLSNGGTRVTVTVGTVGAAAGERLQLVIYGVTNAAAGAQQLTISTSSDTVAKSLGYTLLASAALKQLDAERSTGAPGAMNVAYRLQFLTTAAGGLVGSPLGSMITVHAPPGTQLPTSPVSYAIRDMTTFTCCAVDGVVILDSGATAIITLAGDLAGGDEGELNILGVTNAPGGGGNLVSVSTSSDPTPVTIPFGQLSGPSIGPTRVDLSSNAVGATRARYFINFVGTQQLVAGSTPITITGPPGTSFPTDPALYQIRDTTTGTTQGANTPGVSGGGTSVTLTSSINAPAGDAIQVVIDGVTNGSGTGSHQLSISDAATQAAFSLVAAHSAANRSVRLSSTAAGVGHVEYNVHFTASSSGGLPGSRSSSTVTLAAPAGTVFPASSGAYTVVDTTTGATQGAAAPGVTLSNGGATVTLQLSAPDIRSGDDVLITIENVTNGPSGAQNLGITTSSDTVAASAPFTLAAPRAGSQVKVTLSSATHGATGVTYTVHFATSAIGGVSALSGGTITLAGPAGTVFPMGGMPYSLLDTTTGLMSGGTGMRPQVTLSNFGATATIAFPNPDIASGDHFLVTVSGVQNAPTAGAKTLAVTTSSDTVPANGSFKLG